MYINNRGRELSERPLRDISQEERKAILLDTFKMKRRFVMKKWNISTHTVTHLRFHYGHLVKRPVKRLRMKVIDNFRKENPDATSLDAAEALGLTLKEVNERWFPV